MRADFEKPGVGAHVHGQVEEAEAKSEENQMDI